MLSLAAVSAGYGSFQALFDVSLEVPQGEAVGVIGPNGAGKTTLMRVISGLLPLRDGVMTLEGRPIGGLPAHRLLLNPRGAAELPIAAEGGVDVLIDALFAGQRRVGLGIAVNQLALYRSVVGSGLDPANFGGGWGGADREQQGPE